MFPPLIYCHNGISELLHGVSYVQLERLSLKFTNQIHLSTTWTRNKLCPLKLFLLQSRLCKSSVTSLQRLSIALIVIYTAQFK